MARRRTELTVSLSFLDVMSVGLGSVILLFLIINHASETRSQENYVDLQESVGRQQLLHDQYRASADTLASTLSQRQQRLQAVQAQLDELRQQAAAPPPSAEEQQRQRDAIASLREEVQRLERDVEALRADDNNATLERQGDGDRQYLTGLKVDGYRAMFLVDASASMLAPTVVGAIRRRNLSAAERRASPKWQRTLAAVEWLAAQLPAEGQFQIYVFNQDVRSVLPETTGKWLDVANGAGLERALAALRQVVPGEGTSLHRAFAAVSTFSPRTDNVYLITDGLPTMGLLANERGNISPDRRLTLFSQAVAAVPRAVPVNVILMPMEGDPMAASAFWQLTRLTGGVLLVPAGDWP